MRPVRVLFDVMQERFNSRTREGATQAGGGLRAPGCFNSRTREGATTRRKPCCATLCGFNSRTREGATVHSETSGRTVQGFNSRTREGATETYEYNDFDCVFQFTHP